ncbi:MAG: hypothetical protein R3F19_16680 [Verrucomicrobiales bacterium]
MKTTFVKSLIPVIALLGCSAQAGIFGSTERSCVRAASIARELNSCEDQGTRLSSRRKALLEQEYAALTAEMKRSGLKAEHRKPVAFRKLRNKGWFPAWRS